MASLTSETIASTYDRLLAMDSGGLNGDNLVAMTDGNASATACISITDNATGKAILSIDGSHANGTALLIDNSGTNGDVAVEWQLSHSTIWLMGVEDDGSSSLKICHSDTVGTDERLSFLTASTVVNEDSTDIDFRVEALSLTHALFVQGSDGKVGIGESAPSQNLEIGASAANNATLGLAAAGTGYAAIYLDAANGDYTGSDYMQIVATNDSYGSIGMAGTQDFILQVNGGDVGIGTTTPAAKFHVVSDASTLAWTLGYGMHRHSFDQDIRYAHTAAQSVIVQCSDSYHIPHGAIITLASAVVKTVTNLDTHLVNIYTSTYNGTTADNGVQGTATEILGASASGTQSSDSASATDIDLTQAKEAWVTTTPNRAAIDGDVWIYVLNADNNGEDNSTAGTLSIAIEYFGID